MLIGKICWLTICTHDCFGALPLNFCSNFRYDFPTTELRRKLFRITSTISLRKSQSVALL